jgi:hypothetical protein
MSFERTPMIKELDLVVLIEDLPEHGLKSGDVGTVVHVYTTAVVTLAPAQVRTAGSKDIMHTRTVA